MKFLEDIINIDNKEICGLTDELKCIFINQKFIESKKSILVIANTLYESNKLYQIISNYNNNVLFFPMDDFITSEVLAVSPEFKTTRLNTMKQLLSNDKYIVITNLMGYLRFLPSIDIFKNSFIKLKVGEDYKIEELVEKLYNLGYEREIIINQTGQLSVRGYVIDVFPINENNPVRFEFWGDTIDTIRHFDINSQLTTDKIEEIEIMPNTEFLNSQAIFSTNQRDLVKYGSVSDINEYVNGITVCNDFNELEAANSILQDQILDYCESNGIDPKTQFMNPFSIGYDYNLCKFDNKVDKSAKYIESYDIDIKYKDFADLKKQLEEFVSKKKTVVICMSSRYQANNFIEQLESKKAVLTNQKDIFFDKINIIINEITEGFTIDNFIVISENDLFRKTNKYSNYKNNFKIGTRIKDITKIDIGDYIVHSIYGIGRYCGIKTIKKGNLQKDYLQLEYKDGDKLYIPVEKIELISKYSSKEGFEPRLNKLGSTDWEKVKLRARKRAHEMAFELLTLYAQRETVPGFAFNPDDENQIAFEKEFKHTETQDQIKVMAEIKKDMEAPHPMDRLLCGDVGYGKTEIAFRAAFKAILSGKQVALLCPTTILSSQHYQNALDRFKSFPVNIALLNRFVSQKETTKILEDIKSGKVDFVIGTHKILNDKIDFKNLGLLIIDEEQRFGVIHKEKIRNYRNNIDVLTLSATPIPRTLQLSMANIRSMSLIETPPSNRYPVQTYVVGKNNNLIKEAIYKELARHGQVFILYNHVDGIESKVREISDLVKEARIVYAHGQMPKEKLENIMMDFIDYKYDVLVCTTIIESGIDIPNVNTLIVMEADRFGLSQLYQIRGRVGRTDKIAYCYLLYDQDKILTETATKRLKAIKEFTELGSGFSIAMRDLSIRGAGDILGSEQAGFIDSVGIELFIQMLNEEVAKLNGTYVENTVDEKLPLVDVNTYIDDKYVADEQLKILIHKKISNITSLEKLNEIKKELEDRFGRLNEDINIYMHEQLFEHLANELGIKAIKQNEQKIEIMLDKDLTQKIDGEKLFMETIDITRNFRFSMRGGHLIIVLDLFNLEKHFIYYLIDLLNVIKKAI